MQRFSLIILSLMIATGLVYASENAKVPKTKEGLPLLFLDRFNHDLEKWDPTDKDAWKIETEGENKIYSLFKQSDYDPPVRSPHNMSLVKDLWVSDFIFEAKMKSTSRQYGHRDMCIFFGWQDPSHFYYTHIAPAPNTDPNANSIFIVKDEPRKSIAHKRNNGTEWKDDTWHHIKVVRDTESGTIKVYFDNMEKPILEAKDKTFRVGRIGIGSFDDTGLVDDIHIWAKPEKAPEKKE